MKNRIILIPITIILLFGLNSLQTNCKEASLYDQTYDQDEHNCLLYVKIKQSNKNYRLQLWINPEKEHYTRKFKTGFNIVTIDSTSNKIKSIKNFNTQTTESASQKLEKYIKKIPQNDIIILGTQGKQISKYITQNLYSVLFELGLPFGSQIEDGDKLVMITKRNANDLTPITKEGVSISFIKSDSDKDAIALNCVQDKFFDSDACLFDVVVESGGYTTGFDSIFIINGEKVYYDFKIGFNIVLIDSNNLTVIDKQNFNTSEVQQDVENLIQYLYAIPIDTYILISVKGDGQNLLNTDAYIALSSIGFPEDFQMDYKDSLAFIGERNNQKHFRQISILKLPEQSGIKAILQECLIQDDSDQKEKHPFKIFKSGRLSSSNYSQDCFKHVKLVSQQVPIEAQDTQHHSKNYEPKSEMQIFMNDDRIYGYFGNGFNIVVIDEKGYIITTNHFDTGRIYEDVEKMIVFIDQINPSETVLISTYDDVSQLMNQQLIESLQSVGYDKNIKIGYKDQYVLIGVKGQDAQSVKVSQSHNAYTKNSQGAGTSLENCLSIKSLSQKYEDLANIEHAFSFSQVLKEKDGEYYYDGEFDGEQFVWGYEDGEKNQLERDSLFQSLNNLYPNCALLFDKCEYQADGEVLIVCDSIHKINSQIKSIYVPKDYVLKLYNEEKYHGEYEIIQKSMSCIKKNSFNIHIHFQNLFQRIAKKNLKKHQKIHTNKRKRRNYN